MKKKIKMIWKNRFLIWEGFINKIFKKEPIEKVYNERMKICNLCPELDTKGSKCLVPNTQPCCSVCGCSLSLKLRSLDSECPYPNEPKWRKVVL